MAVPLSPTLTLNSGAEIPQIGFGVWQIDRDGQRVIEQALEAGYRHLDTAMIYHNEAEVGAAVRASGIPRDQLFVTTKLFNTDHGTSEAFDAFDASLNRLGMDYVDLYLIHWPLPSVDRYVESWRALEAIARSGRARSIGVSNFMPEHLTRLLDETDIVPAVNQIEVHPEFQQREASLFGVERGILTEAYSPLANGRILSDERLSAIANRHERSVPQVILRWHVQQGYIAIPKTVNPARMRENLDVFGFKLTPEEMAVVSSFERGGRVGFDPYAG